MIHPKDEDGHKLFTAMILIQTIDNLKKNSPACSDQGSNSDNFFIVDEERGDPNTIESGRSLPPSKTPFKLPAKCHFNGVSLVDQ